MISQYSKNGYKNVANADMVRGFLPHQSTHNCNRSPLCNWVCKFVAYCLHRRTMFPRRELNFFAEVGALLKMLSGRYCA